MNYDDHIYDVINRVESLLINIAETLQEAGLASDAALAKAGANELHNLIYNFLSKTQPINIDKKSEK
jgi:division protein CdvB (Snf7/Vps24/ESCRT-III family)